MPAIRKPRVETFYSANEDYLCSTSNKMEDVLSNIYGLIKSDEVPESVKPELVAARLKLAEAFNHYENAFNKIKSMD